LKKEYIIESELTANKVDRRILELFEAGDILKQEEFDKEYQNFTKFQIDSMKRAKFINNPNLNFIGKKYAGNYVLTSPKIGFWKWITIVSYKVESGSKVSITFKHTWLIFTVLILANLFGLWILSGSQEGLVFLAVSTPLTALFLYKHFNTIRFLRKKLFYS